MIETIRIKTSAPAKLPQSDSTYWERIDLWRLYFGDFLGEVMEDSAVGSPTYAIPGGRMESPQPGQLPSGWSALEIEWEWERLQTRLWDAMLAVDSLNALNEDGLEPNTRALLVSALRGLRLAVGAESLVYSGNHRFVLLGWGTDQGLAPLESRSSLFSFLQTFAQAHGLTRPVSEDQRRPRETSVPDSRPRFKTLGAATVSPKKTPPSVDLGVPAQETRRKGRVVPLSVFLSSMATSCLLAVLFYFVGQKMGQGLSGKTASESEIEGLRTKNTQLQSALEALEGENERIRENQVQVSSFVGGAGSTSEETHLKMVVFGREFSAKPPSSPVEPFVMLLAENEGLQREFADNYQFKTTHQNYPIAAEDIGRVYVAFEVKDPKGELVSQKYFMPDSITLEPIQTLVTYPPGN